MVPQSLEVLDSASDEGSGTTAPLQDKGHPGQQALQKGFNAGSHGSEFQGPTGPAAGPTGAHLVLAAPEAAIHHLTLPASVFSKHHNKTSRKNY